MEFESRHPIIPVFNGNDVESAKRTVACLEEGGINCVEVTLRSENALVVLREIASSFPDMVVGAGTVKQPEDFGRIIEAGAQFAVSPGCTSDLLEEASRWDIPYLPAAATVSELLILHRAGYRTVKIFPAEALGGPKFLKSIAAPLPEMQFVPSGGVSAENCLDYLKLPCVPAVSGSWMLSPELIAAEDWSSLTTFVNSAAVQLKESGLNG